MHTGLIEFVAEKKKKTEQPLWIKIAATSSKFSLVITQALHMLSVLGKCTPSQKDFILPSVQRCYGVKGLRNFFNRVVVDNNCVSIFSPSPLWFRDL